MINNCKINDNIYIYQDVLSDAMRDFLIDLIESQPIYDIPKDFILDAF